jgi:ketosteroid isomerase-like protein
VPTPEQISTLDRAYRCFNDRRIDEVLALLTDDVEWPDVGNGAVLHGRDAVRPYWEAQFAVASPRVDPVEYVDAADDVVAVVDQRVDGLDGATLVPVHVVYHRYSFGAGGRVRRMVVFTEEADALGG